MQLVERLRSGDVRALARAISLVEENAPRAIPLLREVFPETGKARVIGITGAPGSGKSSLVDRLITELRAESRRVGVVAVDPSSAFSGGAILGDRVRMQNHATDPDVFVRSMATRGTLGGLARATSDAIDLLDAAGFDPVLLETVGVGQDEVDVVKTADVVAVVLIPGAGDDIQALKAGILEIADVFVINKADHPGADRLQAELEAMLSLGRANTGPAPEIFQTVAIEGRGVSELLAGMRRFLEGPERQRRESRVRERAEARFRAVLTERVVDRLLEEALPGNQFVELVDRIAARTLDPYSATEGILARLEVR